VDQVQSERYTEARPPMRRGVAVGRKRLALILGEDVRQGGWENVVESLKTTKNLGGWGKDDSTSRMNKTWGIRLKRRSSFATDRASPKYRNTENEGERISTDPKKKIWREKRGARKHRGEATHHHLETSQPSMATIIPQKMPCWRKW